MLLSLMGGILLAATVIFWQFCCRGKSQPHNQYFESLNRVLKEQEPGYPVLLVDLDRVDENIARVKEHLGDTSLVRVAAGSIPSPRLLEYIMERLGSQRIMAFHLPFVLQLVRLFPKSDILLGKPLPVAAFRTFVDELGEDAVAVMPRIQWLVDTPHRLHQYAQVARDNGLRLNVSLEVDTGLHRGGVNNLEALDRQLIFITRYPEQLRLAGLMGYDPQIIRKPAFPGQTGKTHRRERAAVVGRYQEFVRHLQHKWPVLWRDDLCLNGAGSDTYTLNSPEDWGGFNDITIGSAFVKGSDFDVPTLADHKPAFFIATRVLKKLDGVTIPFLEPFSQAWPWLNRKWSSSLFIYGGWWMATPCSPSGLSVNPLYGRSTNQELLTAPPGHGLEVDDFIFLRPHQSEFVMLQFGALRILRDNKVIDNWPVLQQHFPGHEQAKLT